MALGTGDILRTSVNFILPSGDQYQNVYHHIFDGAGGVSDAAVVADIELWCELMYAEIEDYVHDETVAQLCFVDQVEWVTDEWKVVANIGTFTPAWLPTPFGHVCPNQVSPFIVFKTSRPKTVGRKFLFPALELYQDQGTIEAAFVTQLVAFADDAVNDITIDVLNVLHPGVPRTNVNDWLNFEVAIVTDLLGTQRRRRPGYGA